MTTAADLAADLRAALGGGGGVSRELTLEDLVEDRELGALPISPAQRALVLAADGLPVEHLERDRVAFHFGIDAYCFEPSERPRTIIVRTGVRAAKSLIAALAMILCALTCELRRPPQPGERPGPDGRVGVRPGELVRVIIVAPRLRLTRAPFYHLVGVLKASKRLSRYLVPGKTLAESVLLRRDDGAEVLVEMVAASGGGANLRSTWLAGALFDEADFHDDEDEAAVNLKENYQATVTRLLPGGQVWVVSSPWDDAGEFHGMFTDAFGQPGRELAFHSDSISMNPTLSREDIEAERRRDPDNAAREYDAVPLTSGSLKFFPKAAIDAAMDHGRSTNLPPGDMPHWGGTDLGFRKNSSALALARYQTGKVVLAYHDELIPQKGAPLKPTEVCTEFATVGIQYRCASIRGDGIYADIAHEAFGRVRSEAGRSCAYDEWAPTTPAVAEAFTTFRALLLEGKVELTDDARMRKQLEDTKFKKSPDGVGIKVVLPKHGAAHGDVLMAIVLACVQVPLVEQVAARPAAAGSRWGSSSRGYG